MRLLHSHYSMKKEQGHFFFALKTEQLVPTTLCPNESFKHKETFSWTFDFFEQLKQQRKLALRLGNLSDAHAGFNLSQDRLKQLCKGSITLNDLTESDFAINFGQKGVDMRIGVDIASITFKHQVDQIILIAGDSDFVPAAKLARREGIDFILDPMWATIKEDLFEHIDGIHSNWKKRIK